MKLEDHPTVLRYRERMSQSPPSSGDPYDAAGLRRICLAAGADDVGFASLEGAFPAAEAEAVRAVFPSARSAVSLVCRLNPESIRSLSRSTSDLAYLQAMKRVDGATHQAAFRLMEDGVRAFTPASGFPMDLEKWPERMWPVSHKIAAEAAGMGMRGHSRILLHPRFGAFVVLGSMILDAELNSYDKPLAFNPCLECGLCAAVCPVGAVAADGAFGFTTCLTHNYRDRLGGFSQWVEEIVASRSAFDYRHRVSDPETVSIWQAMTYGVSNKCSYCMAVCPAGEDVVGPFLKDRKGFRTTVVKPLQQREEAVYVMAGSDGEAHLARRFPHKKARRAGTGIRAGTVASFLDALPLAFNRNQAKDFAATYHLSFTGREHREATVTIDHGTLDVKDGIRGDADLRLTADGQSWLSFLSGELGLVRGLVSRKIRIKGPPALMKRFAACFPL